MSKSKKPRTHRPTREELLMRMFKREEGRRPLIGDDQTDLRINYWSAFDRVKLGHSSQDNWATLATAMNIALILAERGIGDEYMSLVQQAQEGLIRAQERAHRLNVWRLDGDALQAVANALTVHDAQVEIATRDEMRQAVEEARKREAEQVKEMQLVAA